MGLEGLAPIDGWAIAAILAQAIGYAAALLAMGGPLFLAVFPIISTNRRDLSARITCIAALVMIVVLALQFGIRSARISGMGLAGAIDHVMLGFVWQSPLGTAALWKVAGALAVSTVLFIRGRAVAISLAGSLMIAVSFASVGHSLGDPRTLLAALLVVHLLTAGFWVAALLPLLRAADDMEGAALLHRFGVVASFAVAFLISAGSVFAYLMIGSLHAVLSTAYGGMLLAKLVTVTGLMSLAAANKWRLVPRLQRGERQAARALRRSIRLELALVSLILLATAVLTSITTPPVNL